MKVGDILVWGGGKDKPLIQSDKGLIPCEGQLVSRKDYPLLYAVIGHAYSDEDLRCCNSELFALPDLREIRSPRHETDQGDPGNSQGG